MAKKVVFSLFNNGVIELAMNHIISLRKSGIPEYRAFATDRDSYAAIKELGCDVTLLDRDEPSGILKFDSTDFCRFSYLRYKVMEALLETYDVVWYLDVDTVVLGDIWASCPLEESWDVACQSDLNMPCTGCMVVKSTDAGKRFVSDIWAARTNQTNDQMTIYNMIGAKRLAVPILELSTAHFVNGFLYFPDFANVGDAEADASLNKWQRRYQSWLQNSIIPRPVFVHANFMTGNEKKKQALESQNIWFLKDLESKKT